MTRPVPSRSGNGTLIGILLLLLIATTLAAVYLGIRTHQQSQEIQRLKAQPKSLAPRVAPVARATIEKKPVMTVKRIPRFTAETATCRLCEGSAKVTLERARQDPVVYPCPVCRAMGSTTIEVPRGNILCAECGGIGRVGRAPKRPQTEKYTARLCVKCNGQGWRKDR